VTEIVVYSRPGCHLCDEALAALEALRARASFTIREVDITEDDSLHRAYLERIPVIAIDGEELCDYFLDEALVLERLESLRNV
jgi:glutaredoxin